MKFDRVRGYNAANRVTGFQIQTRRFTLCVMASLGFGFPHISYGLNVRKGPEMPKIAIKAEKHPTEAEVDSAYAAWEVAYDAIGARALEAVRKAFGADTESFARPGIGETAPSSPRRSRIRRGWTRPCRRKP